MTTVKDIREALREGVIDFWYTKKDGSRRNASGTTSMDVIREMDGYEPMGVKENQDENLVNYFDTERGDWRSFRADKAFGLGHVSAE